MNKCCPVCNSKDYKYVYYTEEYWGIVEQHGYCERCGYIIEQAYSQPIEGFKLDRKRGYKLKGKWYAKNTRKRKRMRRKYNIKHTSQDWMLDMI